MKSTKGNNNTIEGRVQNLMGRAVIVATILFFGAVLFCQPAPAAENEMICDPAMPVPAPPGNCVYGHEETFVYLAAPTAPNQKKITELLNKLVANNGNGAADIKELHDFIDNNVGKGNDVHVILIYACIDNAGVIHRKRADLTNAEANDWSNKEENATGAAAMDRDRRRNATIERHRPKDGCCKAVANAARAPGADSGSASPGNRSAGVRMGAIDSSSLDGTVTLEIPSANGRVRVTLPDDIRAGDTISGTVVFPTGTVEGEVVEVKTVDGEVVAVQSSDPRDKIFKFIVPAGMATIPFLLKSASGKHIGTAVVNVKSDLTGTIPTQPGNFAPPRIGQTGRPISIPGNFDGNSSNTVININGREFPVIAESPRKSVVQIPADTPTGPRQLTVRENQGRPRTSDFNVVSVQLNADKLNLMKGETTNLHVLIVGLQGMRSRDDMSMQIMNQSPQVVRLSGGKQMTRPVNANGADTMTFTEKLTGVSPGGFTIDAVLFAPAGPKTKEEKEPTLKERFEEIAKLKREAANATTNTDAQKELRKNARELVDHAEKGTYWDDKDKAKPGLKKYLEDEKKKLDDARGKLAAGETEASKKINDAKNAVDDLAAAAGITLDDK